MNFLLLSLCYQKARYENINTHHTSELVYDPGL